jgi:hypothetical protein
VIDGAYSSLKESDRRDSDADQRVLSGHVPRVATDFHVQLYPEHHFVDNMKIRPPVEKGYWTAGIILQLDSAPRLQTNASTGDSVDISSAVLGCW